MHAIGIALLAALMSVSSGAAASTIQINSRVDLGGNDFVDWRQVPFDLLPEEIEVSSNGGIKVLVRGQQLERADEGASWTGNFAPGDALLAHYGAGPLMLVFPEGPVLGLGTQIQAGKFGDFVGTIEAFDAGGSSLGAFTRAGHSDDAGDNSATFRVF